MSGEDRNLVRARALLDRAGHPNTPEEEARSAAVIAARMIYENGFVLSGSDEEKTSVPPQPAVEPRAAATAAATAAHVQQIWNVFEKNQKNQTRFRRSEEYGLMASRYDGYCKACKRPYKRGEQVAVMVGRGATHYACREFWSRNR